MPLYLPHAVYNKLIIMIAVISKNDIEYREFKARPISEVSARGIKCIHIVGVVISCFSSI